MPQEIGYAKDAAQEKDALSYYLAHAHFENAKGTEGNMDFPSQANLPSILQDTSARVGCHTTAKFCPAGIETWTPSHPQ